MNCNSCKGNEDVVTERIRYCPKNTMVAITKYFKEDTHKLLNLGEKSFWLRAILILHADLHRCNYYTRIKSDLFRNDFVHEVEFELKSRSYLGAVVHFHLKFYRYICKLVWSVPLNLSPMLWKE